MYCSGLVLSGAHMRILSQKLQSGMYRRIGIGRGCLMVGREDVGLR